MWITDIDHLQIAAPKGCEARARRLFGDLLGLQEIEKPASLRLRGGCWFKIGSRQLHIGVEDPLQPATKAIRRFLSMTLTPFSNYCSKKEFVCVWDEALARVRRFYANAPWGNRLEFTPTTRVDPN